MRREGVHGRSTGQLLVEDDEGGRARAQRHSVAARLSTPKMNTASQDRRKLAVQGDWTSHPVVRDAEAAISSTCRLIRLARKTGKRIHVLHVTTGEEMEMLAANKDIATCEVTPPAPDAGGPGGLCPPQGLRADEPADPRRASARRAGTAVNQGIPDVLGSDHAPHTKEEKARPYPASPSGMPGVQTLVPVMLTHVADGKMSARALHRAAPAPARSACSASPARAASRRAMTRTSPSST